MDRYLGDKSLNKKKELTFKDFCLKVNLYSKGEFEELCLRYQKVIDIKVRSTKALGRLGDLSTDGIISETKRIAVYGPENNADYHDNDIANKMHTDFKNLITKHSNLETMVFMTKTSEGMGPKTQLKKKELESEEFQQGFNRKGVTIEYVDKLDMFRRLEKIGQGDTIDYIFDNVIRYEERTVPLSKYFDDPSFISECISEASRQFNNPEAPTDMKIKAIIRLIELIDQKMLRDKRKYNVQNVSDIPYQSWKMFKTGESDYSPSFDVPTFLQNNYQNALPLTPLILKKVLERITQWLRISSNCKLKEDTFLYLFSFYYRVTNSVIIHRSNNLMINNELEKLYKSTENLFGHLKEEF